MVKGLQLDCGKGRGGEEKGRMVLELPGREHHRAGHRGANRYENDVGNNGRRKIKFPENKPLMRP